MIRCVKNNNLTRKSTGMAKKSEPEKSKIRTMTQVISKLNNINYQMGNIKITFKKNKNTDHLVI
ncbi:hypothetical protein Hanom_Chr16g01422941 [Helianthus anomalus]